MGFEPFTLDIDEVAETTSYGTGLTQLVSTRVVIRVEFADLGGTALERGKVCFDVIGGNFKTCSGTTSFCPKGPPPPTTPPPPQLSSVLLELAATSVTTDRIQLGLTREVFVFDTPHNDVPNAMQLRFVGGGGLPAYKSFHVYKVLDVINPGGHPAAAGLSGKFLAVPVQGSGVHP